jgi:membrane associated rhomboid family serine protease
LRTLRKKFELFCYRNSSKGIPNLMLWIAAGNVLVYLLTSIDPSAAVYSLLYFNKSAILSGEVWRLLTYILIPSYSSILSLAIMMFFYVQIGRVLESNWGTLKFNLYYLTGILLADLCAMVLPGGTANTYYLNLSLILAFASLYPDNQVLLFFIIPLRMKYLAWFYFALTAFEIVSTSFPVNLLPVFALLNYFLYFGKDVRYVFTSNRYHPGQGFSFKSATERFQKAASKKQKTTSSAPNPNWADNYRSASGQKPYHHKCTVCGRTDTEYPDLEFRYCSRCNGYYCYCMDHINNHTHIQ